MLLSTHVSRAIAFIDSAVPDVHTLLNGVEPGTEVILLDSSQDGIKQISAALASRKSIKSIHIVSHGNPGSLQLGAAKLSLTNFDSYGREWQQWSAALAEKANILVYGCEVAAGEKGSAFVQKLSQVTGADIAASASLTGNAVLGGNWDLEFATGKIETPLVFSQEAMETYSYVLMPEIIINEFRRDGQFQDNEYIELLLTQDLTATQLESFFVGDSTIATDAKNSAYKFTNMASIASVFKAGTIIVIGGPSIISTDDITYNPVPGGTDADWNIKLRINNGAGGAFLDNVLVGSNAFGGDFAATDVVWVDSSSAGTTSVNSIAWPTSGLGAFGSAAKVQIPAPNNANNVEFTNSITGVNITANYAINSAGSQGLPNSGINTVWINNLRNPLAPLTFIGSETFASTTNYAGTTLGGLSGITYNSTNNSYYSISDGRNIAANPGDPRFYTLTIDVSSGALLPGGVAFTGVRTIGNPAPFGSNTSDTEGIALAPNGTDVYISSEGIFSGATPTSQPFINSFNITTGQQNQVLTIPGKFTASAIATGIVSNRAFESLTITPDRQFIFTATEQALKQDGAATNSRILRYNLSTGTSDQEFLYQTDSGNGISELLALDNNTFLVIDRSVTTGIGKLYQVSLQGATDISSFDPLPGTGVTAVKKTLVLDLSSFPLGTNFEGMTFGPVQANGKRSLILVSDNNFGAGFGIPTGFAAFTANNAPVLDNSLSPALTSINKNISPTSNLGTLVSSLIGGGAVTDLDTADSQGMVVTSVDNSNGSWEYSTNNGSNWTSLAPTTTAAVLLAGSTLIRFLPNLNYGGTANINYRAWDGTTGTSGGTLDISLASNVGGVMAFSSASETATITVNDPGTFNFSLPTYSVNENGTTATITVDRTGSANVAADVNYSTSDGTANTGSDYTAVNGYLSFGIGELTKTFAIPIIDDVLVEGDESVNLSLNSPTNGAALGGQNTAILTINDDDVADSGTFSFSNPTYSVNENGTTATITVDRTGSANVAADVNYSTSDGTANAGSDYTAVNGYLSFGIGELTKTFAIPIIDDALVEENETVNLSLNSPTNGATLGAISQAILTIIDTTPTPIPSSTPIPLVTPIPSVTPTPTLTPTPSVTPTPTLTPTPSVTPTPTLTPTPSVTPTPTLTPTPSFTSTPIPIPSFTPIPSVTPTPILTIIPSVTLTPTLIPIPLVTLTPTPTLIPFSSEENDCICKQITLPSPGSIPEANSIERTLIGTDSDDTIIGNNANDAIDGFGSSDILFGQPGNDNIYGGFASEFPIGSESDRDLLLGNEGNDYINGNAGNDSIFAGKDDDVAIAGKDNDLIWGDRGNDTILGNEGADSLFGGTLNLFEPDLNDCDLLFGGSGDDFLNGEEGNDTLSGDDGNDRVRGGKNNDVVLGGDGNDLLLGDRGDDSICGGDGNDTIFGDTGSAIAVSSSGENDCICGGSGNDLIFGGEGTDKLGGEEGNDTLYGGKNDNTLTGGTGDDWLWGDLGDDILAGGSGSDRFVLTAVGGSDAIADFAPGEDLLILTDGLTFEQLSITQDVGGTVIAIGKTGVLLATLSGVQANLINQEIFMLIG